MQHFWPKMRAWLVVLALVVIARPVPAALPDTIEQVRPSIVGIGTAYPPRQPLGGKPPNSLNGTGFVVGDGRFVVTNFHVLPELLDYENNQSLVVFSGRGRKARVHPAEVLVRDALHDLALLRIEGGPLPALALGSAARMREGDRVAFTGFPIGAVLGLYPATHEGIIASITPVVRTADTSRELSAAQLMRMRNPYNVFQLDAIAYPGNSGSPLYLPDSGKVIGVVNSVFVKESRETILERPSGITYAIPVQYVHDLINSADAATP